MSVVLVLMVALTFPNDKPTEYRPIKSWDARSSTLSPDYTTCKSLVRDYYQKGIKAKCEIMTSDQMLVEARK